MIRRWTGNLVVLPHSLPPFSLPIVLATLFCHPLKTNWILSFQSVSWTLNCAPTSPPKNRTSAAGRNRHAQIKTVLWSAWFRWVPCKLHSAQWSLTTSSSRRTAEGAVIGERGPRRRRSFPTSWQWIGSAKDLSGNSHVIHGIYHSWLEKHFWLWFLQIPIHTVPRRYWLEKLWCFCSVKCPNNYKAQDELRTT